MKFKDKFTGTIYDVTNERLLPSYEGSERFEKVAETSDKPVKKATKSAKKATEEQQSWLTLLLMNFIKQAQE